MFVANEDIKNRIKKLKIPQWLVAYKMGVSDQTLIRWLRTPLNEEHRLRIEQAIEEIIKNESN